MKLLNEIELKLSKTIKSEDFNFFIVLSFFVFCHLSYQKVLLKIKSYQI